MQIITSKEYNKYRKSNTCLAIGAFDGLHKGHQLIINEAIKEASENNYPAAVLSFHPHPLEIIPGNPPPTFNCFPQTKNFHSAGNGSRLLF